MIPGVVFVREIFEIIAAVLAVYGFWQILYLIREEILYPRRIRKRVNAAIYIDNGTSDLPEIAAYVKSLAKEGKISRGRLIIVAKSDIIDNNAQNARDFVILRAEEAEDGQSVEGHDDRRDG